MTTAAPYIDAAAFTALFRNRRRNHASICTGLAIIAKNVGRQIQFPTADERNDAIAEVTLHAVQRIDRFNFARGGDAFAYYTSVISRELTKAIKRMFRQRFRAFLFSQVADDCQHWPKRDELVLDNATPYARAS